MGNLRARLVSWATRRYLARAQKKGLDLSKLAILPDAALMPLRRDGLDPVPELGEVREREPISKLPVPFGFNVWLVTGYDEAKAVLVDATSFSNDFGNLVGKPGGAGEEENPGGLGFADPPAHTRLRKLLTPEFTMRRLSRLKPGIATIVGERLDAMEKAGSPVDLVEEFALPVPSLVICELLGVPYEERDEFQHLAVARFDLFGGAGASLGAISESLEYLLGVVRAQRENPGDGLLGMIIKEHGDEVSDRELAGLADGVLTGGFETTASMLSLGALVLLRDAEAFARVRDDDESVNGFVEELLRYLTVVQVAFPRFAREDVEVAGTTIKQGDMVVVSLSGANRDPALGEAMEIVDGTRPPTQHLAFGYGAHRCIGAELARMELRAAYPALLRRFPELRLAVDPDELTFRKTSIVYGVEKLPVILS
ncbi:cytochrome P450 [Prauserella muralis]|uniref:Cytochrome n=1 Tax=Prauserella muralis TaxID=588067 RepID=A0A2V4AJQ4_9PSEU|nr:cytochrome P450 [Prauserella muralis]PXY19406.1 cytochrome [Prauserella muralis]TWE29380.1 cytochrome P450 [Prauserella muralis]